MYAIVFGGCLHLYFYFSRVCFVLLMFFGGCVGLYFYFSRGSVCFTYAFWVLCRSVLERFSVYRRDEDYHKARWE